MSFLSDFINSASYSSNLDLMVRLLKSRKYLGALVWHCHPDELQENLDPEESLFRSPWTNRSRNFTFQTEI
ncbi:hypothetical protein NPIL_455711 [Nephila pilipes]|uniref:Uncharacterized protein n=1 Tax=Nephila pilipes TaxID=299642 RepID=A0A8X6NKH8_NEPPI|nr:hypothetical protein NPIL_455711 [Nephila pilipes]